ncbi:hypothetical protein WI93_15340 [Burkholderia vietnamiensis]|nr:hypothetical protein WI93_15340 [Burkholderia vietnamiensis]
MLTRAARARSAPRATTVAIATGQVHCAAGRVGRDGRRVRTSRPPPGLEARPRGARRAPS